MDAVKRSLLAGCFLERKPPDILYFAHKSFAEFLIAEAISELVRRRENCDQLKMKFSAEILDFVFELIDADDVEFIVGN